MRYKRKTKQKQKIYGLYFHAEKMGCAQERTRNKKVNISKY